MFKMTILRRMQFCAAATLLLAAGAGQAQWMWVDANGLKQVSDRPPPASVPAKNILRAPVGAASAPGADAAAPAAAPGAEAKDNSVAAREADYRKRQAEKAEADKKTAQEARVKENKAIMCRNAQMRKAAFDSGRRVKSGPGKAEYMDDKTKAAETERAERDINEHCG